MTVNVDMNFRLRTLVVCLMLMVVYVLCQGTIRHGGSCRKRCKWCRALQAAEKLIHGTKMPGFVTGYDPPRRIVPIKALRTPLGFSPCKSECWNSLLLCPFPAACLAPEGKSGPNDPGKPMIKTDGICETLH